MPTPHFRTSGSFILHGLAALALLGSGAQASARSRQPAPLGEAEAAAIRLACEDLSEQYTYALDGGDANGLAALFTDDGVWEVTGRHIAGAAAIRDYWSSRSATKAAGDGRLHQIANQIVTVIDRNHATGRSIALAYRFKSPSSERQSLAPEVIARNDDEYVRTPAGWRFKRRTITTLATQDPR